MTGRYENQHALLPITIRVAEQSDLDIEFVIDTGFGGDLTLPLTAVTALGLPYDRSLKANLADDSVVELAVHAATILWHGSERAVDVLATGARPLLGMNLLAGSELVVQCADGGLVMADEL